MGFVQASMLAALAAVILPILAHLLFRRRSRPVDLGTLRFLKVAVRQDTRRRKLSRQATDFPGRTRLRPTLQLDGPIDDRARSADKYLSILRGELLAAISTRLEVKLCSNRILIDCGLD